MGFGSCLVHAGYDQALLDGTIVFKPLLFNIINPFWRLTFDEFRGVGWLGMSLANHTELVAVFAGMKPRLEGASAKMRRILRDHYLAVKRLFDWAAAICGLLLHLPGHVIDHGWGQNNLKGFGAVSPSPGWSQQHYIHDLQVQEHED